MTSKENFIQAARRAAEQAAVKVGEHNDKPRAVPKFVFVIMAVLAGTVAGVLAYYNKKAGL